MSGKIAYIWEPDFGGYGYAIDNGDNTCSEAGYGHESGVINTINKLKERGLSLVIGENRSHQKYPFLSPYLQEELEALAK